MGRNKYCKYKCTKCREDFDGMDRGTPSYYEISECPNCGAPDRYLEIIEDED